MDTTVLAAVGLGLLVLYFVIRLLWIQKQNPAVLKQKINEGALVVDVRTPVEFGDGHYDGALNIPVDTLSARITEFGIDKNRCVIVYCASGSRSAKAARILKDTGFNDVINVGGLFNMPRD